MLSYQGVEQFERIRKIRRSGLVGGSMSLVMSFEVSEPMPGLLFLSPCMWSRMYLSATAPAPRLSDTYHGDDGLNL